MFTIWASLEHSVKIPTVVWGFFFSVSFLSCLLFLSSSSLTYLEQQPEKASAQLLFPLEQTPLSMLVFPGYNLT